MSNGAIYTKFWEDSLLQLLNPSRWYGVLVPLCPAVYFARPGVRSAVGFPPPNPSVVNAYDGDYYGLAYVIAYILFGGDLVFGSLCFNQKFLTKREENLKTLLTQLFEWANGQSFGVRSRVYWLVHAVVTALVGAVSEQDLDDFMRVRPESFNALIYFWNQDFLYEKFMTKSSLNYANCPRSKAVVSKECQRSTTLADDPLNKELFSGQNAFVSGRFCCCLGGNSALVFTEKVEGSGRMPELSELSEPVV